VSFAQPKSGKILRICVIVDGPLVTRVTLTPPEANFYTNPVQR